MRLVFGVLATLGEADLSDFPWSEAAGLLLSACFLRVFFGSKGSGWRGRSEDMVDCECCGWVDRNLVRLGKSAIGFSPGFPNG
ncbi:Hypothetical protein SPLC1_S580090 [Arthrospira platensis C1]|nr:Hypothetical protein SPLC1_S580090 [Arthrospira platensis C1]